MAEFITEAPPQDNDHVAPGARTFAPDGSTEDIRVEYQHNLTGAEVLTMVEAAAILMAGNLENKCDLEGRKGAADRIQMAIWNFAAGQLRAFADAVTTFPLTEPRVAEDGVIPFEDMSPDEKEATIHAAGYEQGMVYGHTLGFEEGVRTEQLRAVDTAVRVIDGEVIPAGDVDLKTFEATPPTPVTLEIVEPGSATDPFTIEYDVSNADMPVLDPDTQENNFQKEVDEAEVSL
jgi:hypothetical protein